MAHACGPYGERGGDCVDTSYGLLSVLRCMYIFRTIVCCRRVGQVASILSYLLRSGRRVSSAVVYLVKCNKMKSAVRALEP